MKEHVTSILIVDDEKEMSSILSRIFNKEGIKTLIANDGLSAMQILHDTRPDILLLDVKMPGMDGFELLRESKKIYRDIPVIMLTAYSNIHEAIKAIRDGAVDYLSKPFNHAELIGIVREVLNKNKFNQDGIRQQPGDHTTSLRELMGPSDEITKLIAQVNCVAKSDFTVVIIGESGTGKELVASEIHRQSFRSKAQFVPVDCGAIPETLLESELFGFEKGAFTGAGLQKVGKIEASIGGTLFLDEISNMSMASQAKLLRVLQEKRICRLGSVKQKDVDIRTIAASNRDLNEQVASGSFRQDLFFRLQEFMIQIPPLRERKEDIPYLAKRFLDITNSELRKNVYGFSKDALEALCSHDWPGNVRQFRSTIRRAVLLADEMIHESHLDLETCHLPVREFASNIHVMPRDGLSLKEIVRRTTSAVEREVLVEILKQTGGNKAETARILRVDYKTVHTKVKEFSISLHRGEYHEKERKQE
jgi:DNA-binding NtrC family response regulator